MSKAFQNYLAEVDQEVEAAISATSSRGGAVVTAAPSPLDSVEAELRVAAESICSGNFAGAIELNAPPPEIDADYAIPAFALSKSLKRAPNDIAGELTTAIKRVASDLVETAVACGPYVNITTRREKLYDRTLRHIISACGNYGRTAGNSGKVAVIDFSSPNIAKPLGIGHLRSTIIGHALSNIYEWTGYTVLRDNHLGDWGTQFGELIYAYQAWGDKEAIQKDPIRELKNLYVRFHVEEKNNPAIRTEARRLFSELDAGDEKLLALWKQFRDWSIAGFNVIYRRIGVHFDLYLGESYFTNKTEAVVGDCLAKGLARQDQDSPLIVVDTLENIPSFLLRKQDGSALYVTRDLAAIKYRVEHFHAETILYVVGSEQSLNFKQLFALARKAGYLPDNAKAEHIPFGMVLSGNKKMSTRAGTVVELEDVLERAIGKARETLKQNNPSLSKEEEDKIAESVGIGAVLYHDLRQLRTTNISFDWDKITSLEAGTSAYLQYTYVRIKSILDKAGALKSHAIVDSYRFENQKEFSLAKKLLFFEAVIKAAQKGNVPHVICTYLEELSQLFNSFYSEVPVLTTKDPALLASRLALLNSTGIVIENGLKILGISIPPKM